MSGTDGPHRGQPVATAGPLPADAEAAVVLAHGRGATAEGILGLAEEIDRDGVAYLAPQAAGRTWYPAWYPDSFLAPRERNQPGIASGLAAIGDALADLGGAGVPPNGRSWRGSPRARVSRSSTPPATPGGTAASPG